MTELLDCRRVLMVEDEPRLREMLLRAIREMGFDPEGVGSAEAAMKKMESDPSPVMIIDLNLPAAGGLELLQTVRARWPQTQAVILTGFGDLDAARQAIHLEVVDFLTKPCGLGDLEVALGRAFRRVRGQLPAAVAEEESKDPDSCDDAPRSLAPALNFSPLESPEAMSLEDVEREVILRALERHAGNRPAAAKELGISIRKLYYRLAQYQGRKSDN